MTEPGTVTVVPDRLPTGLLITSTLCWVMGVVLVGIALAQGVLAVFSRNGNAMVRIATLLIGFGYCYAGHGLRRRRRSAAWLAVLGFGSSPVIELIRTGRISILGVIYAVIVVLIIDSWKFLEPPRTGTAA